MVVMARRVPNTPMVYGREDIHYRVDEADY